MKYFWQTLSENTIVLNCSGLKDKGGVMNYLFKFFDVLVNYLVIGLGVSAASFGVKNILKYWN